MPKISNALLQEIIEFAKQNPSFSLKDCCKKLDYSQSTVYNWYTKLKKGTWKSGYSKTDQEPLSEEIINNFINAFTFTDSAKKILKKISQPQLFKR